MPIQRLWPSRRQNRHRPWSTPVTPNYPCYFAVIFPESGVYELLYTGRVAPNRPELGSYQYGHLSRDGIQHPFFLRSAYSLLSGTPDALTFTNYTPAFKGMIDHIWYSTNTLEATALLGPIDPEYMKRVPGFPNYHFPSDHVPLLAKHPEPDFGPQRSDRRN